MCILELFVPGSTAGFDPTAVDERDAVNTILFDLLIQQFQTSHERELFLTEHDQIKFMTTLHERKSQSSSPFQYNTAGNVSTSQ